MLNKYDIGILTFWNVPNCGTFAQAYALQKAIQKIRPEKNVVQLDHLDQRHFDFYYNQKVFYRSFPIWKRTFWKSVFLKDSEKSYYGDTFFKAYDLIPHTEKITKSKLKDFLFEKIYLGSDIIWDYSIDVFNKDRLFFGEGFDCVVNAYAASFGTIKKGDMHPAYVVKNIKKMRHISVRDKKSAELVEEITGKEPPVVLDPTWLWDFETDDTVKVPDEEPYILVYGENLSNKFIEGVIKYAKCNQLKIIWIDCRAMDCTWCDKCIRKNELEPFMWIGYFQKAVAIATNGFHGLTFGLIFKKKIAVYLTDFLDAKANDFLKELGLYEIFLDRDDSMHMLDYSWDYDKIDPHIDVMRQISWDFLKTSLNR